jgi:hypothetical protein
MPILLLLLDVSLASPPPATGCIGRKGTPADTPTAARFPRSTATIALCRLATIVVPVLVLLCAIVVIVVRILVATIIVVVVISIVVFNIYARCVFAVLLGYLHPS